MFSSISSWSPWFLHSKFPFLFLPFSLSCFSFLSLFFLPPFPHLSLFLVWHWTQKLRGSPLLGKCLTTEPHPQSHGCKYVSSQSASYPSSGRVLLIWLGWPLTCDPSASSSWLAGITGACHIIYLRMPLPFLSLLSFESHSVFPLSWFSFFTILPSLPFIPDAHLSLSFILSFHSLSMLTLWVLSRGKERRWEWRISRIL